MSEIRSIAPLLPANDVRAAVEWYQAKLGFRCLFAYPPEHPDYAGVAREGAEIHFFRMKIDPAGSDWMCYLRVAGIEDLYQEFAPRGIIHPNGPLEVKPWGQREFAVTDLNGTLLRFGEAAGASPPRGSDPRP